MGTTSDADGSSHTRRRAVGSGASEVLGSPDRHLGTSVTLGRCVAVEAVPQDSVERRGERLKQVLQISLSPDLIRLEEHATIGPAKLEASGQPTDGAGDQTTCDLATRVGDDRCSRDELAETVDLHLESEDHTIHQLERGNFFGLQCANPSVLGYIGWI